MAIRERILLEGVEALKQQLNQAVRATEDFSGKVNALNNGGAGLPFQNLSNDADRLRTSYANLGTATTQLRGAKLLLRPVLQQVGQSLGSIGALAGAARLGIGGLAIAAGATAVVALAKLSDESEKTKKQLQDLTQSRQTGNTLFDKLNKDAEKLGTTIGALGPVLQSAIRAFQALNSQKSGQFFTIGEDGIVQPGLPGELQKISDAANGLFTILRQGGASETEAKTAATAFFTELEKGKKVTAEMLDALGKVAPGAINEISKAFKNSVTDTTKWIATVGQTPIEGKKFIDVLAKINEQVKDQPVSKAFDTVDDAFARAKANIDRGLQSLTGKGLSQFVIGEIDKFGADVNSILQDIARVKGALDEVRGVNVQPGTTGNRSAIQQAIDFVDPTALDRVQEFFREVVDLGAVAWERVTELFSETLSKIDFSIVETAFSNLFTNLGNLGQSAWDRIRAIFTTPIDFSAVISSFTSAFEQLVSLAQSIWDRIKSIFSQPVRTNIGGGLSDGPFLAGGGYVRGPGTSTSDSILAWLSDREYVINAKAVSHYGAGFFAALNSMRLPKDFFQGFNMGGLVTMPRLPRFADGGMVAAGAGGTPVTLVIDGNRFGMSATTDTVKKLQQFSVRSQMISTGRKPGWFR